MSRGTTIGSPNCRVNSAIFFTSDELTKQRIQNLTTTATGDICLKIENKTSRKMGEVFTEKQTAITN